MLGGKWHLANNRIIVLFLLFLHKIDWCLSPKFKATFWLEDMLGSIHNLPRGALWWFSGEAHSFSLLWFRGGCWKFATKNDIKHMGSWTIFSWKIKGNENMLLDALIIPVFHFISTKCWYRIDAHYLCYKASLWVAQAHSRHPPHSCFPHSHSPHTHSSHSHDLQELKDDLLDDIAWPVVMQWFNEDH